MSYSCRTITLVFGVLSVLLLSGCGQFSTPQDNVEERYVASYIEPQSLNNWLAISRRVSSMTETEVAVAIKNLATPQNHQALFYYGVLNQNLGRIDGWVQARDTFRELTNEDNLAPNLRELARIFLVHNQALINWHTRHRGLQKELVESVLDREHLEHDLELLELKIEALTDVEAVISSRKQQTLGDVKVGEGTLNGGR